MQQIVPTLDEMHVEEPRAAGIDVHKLQLTVSLRLCQEAHALPAALTQEFPTHPQGLREMVAWLTEHHVGGAAMEGTGVYWEQSFRVLEAGGITPRLVHAQQVKQIKGRKTDVADSMWLARICQFGLARASFVCHRRNSRKCARCAAIDARWSTTGGGCGCGSTRRSTAMACGLAAC